MSDFNKYALANWSGVPYSQFTGTYIPTPTTAQNYLASQPLFDKRLHRTIIRTGPYECSMANRVAAHNVKLNGVGNINPNNI